MNPLADLKTRILPVLILFVLAWSPPSPVALALLPPPPPDGGYPGGNTAEGEDALFNLTIGTGNTANGFKALFSDTTGSFNTSSGFGALFSNTTGSFNTADGVDALFSNTTGLGNTATGDAALADNTTGERNTATGESALLHNTVGYLNTATGGQALFFNRTGSYNTATGFNALGSNITGSDNTADGVSALESNTHGLQNTAIGVDALANNRVGSDNTATGGQALVSNMTGNRNTAGGVSALLLNSNGNGNTANGYAALFNATGNFNMALGNRAGFNVTMGSHNIDIGNEGRAGDSGQMRIGTPNLQVATFIAGIRDVTVPAGLPVVVAPNGQLGTLPSSVRFKEAIEPMVNVSEAILALKPITFRYNKELDPDAVQQFGLLAEDVERVNPDLVVRDKEGKPYTVRYDQVNAMLLNEFLKEHRKVQKLEANSERQQKQIEALTAGLRKVSAQIQLSEPEPQAAANNQ